LRVEQGVLADPDSGFVGDEIGFGLHLAVLYRNLDEVFEADRRVVRVDPGAYVDVLYGHSGRGGDRTTPGRHGVTSAGERRSDS
jgi:hypothetical protein